MTDEWSTSAAPIPMLIARIDDDCCDRIVAVFDEPGGFAVPLDADRPINRQLLEAEEIVLVHDDETVLCRVARHERADDDTVERLSGRVGAHISDATEVLHLVPQVGPGLPHLVAVLDGSERAMHGLDVAAELGDWFGMDVGVAAVGELDDVEAQRSMASQAESAHTDDIDHVAPDRITDWAKAISSGGGLIVGAALGEWQRDARMSGLVPHLVADDVASVIGVGPGVPADWRPRRTDPIVVAVDATVHAAELVGCLEPLLRPPRTSVVVVHVAEPDPAVGGKGDELAARRVAGQINERWGIPARFATVDDPRHDPASALARYAAREHAQLVVTHSWHRPVEGRPPRASTSVALMAQASCPVVVFSGEIG